MNVGVFFGGKNTEHDVSIITGQLVIKELKQLGYSVLPIYISKEGKWFIDEKMDNLDFFKKLNDKNGLQGLNEFNINLNESKDGSANIKTQGFLPKSFKIDLAFPAIHGKNGEDGTLQGLLELLNIPYVGCDVPSSAISIDKVLTKLFYQRFNIPTTKFIYFQTKDWINKKNDLLKDIKNTLTWPVFVKPARLGSSIGMSKVKSEEELEFAIEVALHYDNKILIEESVEDLMDITVCVLGNDEPQASLIQESAYTKDFFTYEDKYINEGGAQTGNADKKIIIPASLEEKITEEIRNMAVETFKLFGCSGIARIDFLYDKTFKKYYANEINTLPGTLYYHLWQKSGIPLSDLLKNLLDLAKEKHKQKNKLTYTFESGILKQTEINKLKGN